MTDTNQMRSAIRMADDTLANGGATYTLGEEGLVPREAESYLPSEYVVGGAIAETIVSGDSAADLAIAICKFTKSTELLLLLGYDIGTWLNPNTGRVHLGIVDTVNGLEIAVKHAQELGGLAIYHPRTGESISITN